MGKGPHFVCEERLGSAFAKASGLGSRGNSNLLSVEAPSKENQNPIVKIVETHRLSRAITADH